MEEFGRARVAHTLWVQRVRVGQDKACGCGRVRVGAAVACISLVVRAWVRPSVHKYGPARVQKFIHTRVYIAGLACSSPMPFSLSG